MSSQPFVLSAYAEQIWFIHAYDSRAPSHVRRSQDIVNQQPIFGRCCYFRFRTSFRTFDNTVRGLSLRYTTDTLTA